MQNPVIFPKSEEICTARIVRENDLVSYINPSKTCEKVQKSEENGTTTNWPVFYGQIDSIPILTLVNSPIFFKKVKKSAHLQKSLFFPKSVENVIS